MAYLVPLDIPECCAECFFRSPYEEISVNVGIYKKISRCYLAPEEIEDPWRDIVWSCKNKERWCPLKKVADDTK